jgi:hypothetical protein
LNGVVQVSGGTHSLFVAFPNCYGRDSADPLACSVYTLIIVYARLDGLELRANCLHALEKMLQTVMFVARKEIAHLETHVNAILVT